jgi:hypothetical protein
MTRSALLSRLMFALLAAAMMSPAKAQADRCTDYANQMVAWDSRARQTRCVGWTGSSNHRGHYDWCQARPPGAAQTALTTWASRFQNCEFQASGSAAARADGQRCIAYGDEMVRMDRSARQQGCQGWNSSSNRNGHIEFCMAHPERVDGALHHWRNRLRAC